MQLARSLVVTVAVRAGSGLASAQTDLTQSDACLQDGPGSAAAIDKDMTEGAGFSVNGTPTFFTDTTTPQGFEGFRIVGAQPDAVFQPRIEGPLK
jgi:protein-disulfide isomerase